MQPYMSCEPEDGPAIYDLYGVINHMGRLLGGHYTAYARTTAKHDSRQSEVGKYFFFLFLSFLVSSFHIFLILNLC